MNDLATLLDNARLEGRLLQALPVELTLTDAYAVQASLLERALSRGERLIGWKMGMTSRAKMQQMNVHAPIHAWLSDRMLLEDGATLRRETLRQPRVEPEICFVMGADISGPVTAAQALAAVKGVCAAIEVLDSRYEDFRFNLPNVVADNASAAFVVLGSELVSPGALDNLGIVLECDGRVVETASSAAVYDHPARALAALINAIAPRSLRAGDIVMSGGATQAVSLAGVSQVRVSVERIGSATLRIA